MLWKKVVSWIEKNSEMKTAGDVLSPVNWLFLVTMSTPSFIFLFRPTLMEFAYLQIIELLSSALIIYIDKRYFLSKHTHYNLIFPNTRWEKIQNLPLEGQKKLFSLITKYPDERSHWCLKLSLIKYIPVFLTFTFLLTSNSSVEVRILKALGYCFLIQSYFYASAYFDTHYFCSKLIREIHKKLNWSEAFRSATYDQKQSDFSLQENLSLFAILISTLYLQTASILDHNNANKQLILEVILLGFIGSTLLARTWLRASSYLNEGFKSLIEDLEKLDTANRATTIPLHSSAILGKYQTIVNQLTSRLEARENEITECSPRGRTKSLPGPGRGFRASRT